MTALARIEHEIGRKLTRMTSLETARVSAQQTAEALGSYDPGPERSEIEQQSSQLQQQLSDAQAEKQQLIRQVGTLDQQIADLESEVSSIRSEESTLRDRALREDPIAAAETTVEARELGRRADALEVQASNLDARRSVLGPQIEALDVRIAAIDARLAILSQAGAAVTAEAQRSMMESSEARERAQEFAAELATLASEISALHQDEAQAALTEARQALEKAVSTGRRANADVADGTLVAAGASRSLGDLLARRAASLSQTASIFSGVADRGQGDQARRLSNLADQLSQRADSLKGDAISAYESAASGLRRVRAQGDTRAALQDAADNLDRAIERLGGSSASDDDWSGEQPADGGTPAGDSDESGSEMGPDLAEVKMHIAGPKAPVVGIVTRNERCTAGSRAAGFVRHIEVDVSNTPLAGSFVPGQSFGVHAPGEDHRGRPHALRLYSIASPSAGEDGNGGVIATTVKRLIDENAAGPGLHLGVTSNYLCDLQPGDELKLS
ncbi:3-dioxygenase subunit A) (Benzoyl-CoA dioxygenase reductase component), partial [Durusdinium trenchii]